MRAPSAPLIARPDFLQLFYHDSPRFLVLSSEIRAIAKLDFLPFALDKERFAHHLIFLEPAGEVAADTWVEGVKRLMPVNWLSWKDKQLSTRLYWKHNPDYKVRFRDDLEYGLALRELLQQAVDDRIRTEFPVGATLSGGLDSSTVVCLAARRLAERGRSFYTASSVLAANHGGIDEDERPYIDFVLDQEKNVLPRFVTADGIGASDSLTKVFDKPYVPVNCFYYMDKALAQSLAPHARVVAWY